MNNYLSNIAARALNPAPTVRPRSRGRFDPAQNEPSVDRLKLVPTESIDSERPIEKNLAATSANQRAHEHHHASQRRGNENDPHTLSFAHRDEKSTSALPNDTLVSSPQKPVLHVPIATAAVSTTQATRPVSVNPLSPIASRLERDAPPARAEQRRLREPRSDQARPSDSREIKTIIVREQRIIEASEQAREPGSRSSPVSAVPPSDERKRGDTTPPPAVVQTHIAPLVEKGLDFPLSRPAPQPQPTVRVTIGRIEVRAVASSEAPAKPRATPPVMNLDDYLRRRNQGSSR